jgi:hypothetical protein
MNSIEKLGAPTIDQFHSGDNADPLVYGAYFQKFDDDPVIVGYVLAINGDTAWVRGYSSDQAPDGEEGTLPLSEVAPVYVVRDGLDWDIPLIGGLNNTKERARLSLVDPPRPLSQMVASSFHQQHVAADDTHWRSRHGGVGTGHGDAPLAAA